MWDIIRKTWVTHYDKVSWCNTPGCANVGHGWKWLTLERPEPDLPDKIQGKRVVWAHYQKVDGSASYWSIDSEATKRLRTDEYKAKVWGDRLPQEEDEYVPKPKSLIRCTDPPSPSVMRFQDVEGPLSWVVEQEKSPVLGWRRKLLFDLHKSDFLDYDLLVSKKRVSNLRDLTNSWRRSVLAAHSEAHGDLPEDMDTWEC
jgi:hypothetical protein